MHDNILMSGLLGELERGEAERARLEERAPRQGALGSGGIHRLFVRDLALRGRIGVEAEERREPQLLRVNLELTVRDSAVPVEDRYENVVCYDEVVSAVRRLVAAGPVALVETLAERIAALCLRHARVEGVRVRVEKAETYPDAAGVGVEMERFRAGARTNISQRR
jgi:dihydroneopterin aldolase